MGALSSSSSQLILGYIFRSPPPTSFSLFKPLHATSLRTTSAFFSSLSSPPFLSSSPPPFPLCLCNPQTLVENPINTVDTYEDDSDYGEFESGDEDFESEKENSNRVLDSSVSGANKESVSKLPSLTVKEKKELASYAHSLGKKLKSQQVGKSGVTDSVATSLIETLEANELLKIKIHGSCPGELDDAVKRLEEATGSVVVGRIGRTVILYRPSLAKLKAEEKKKQAQRVFAKRQLASKSSLQNQGQVQRGSARGRRGISRF